MITVRNTHKPIIDEETFNIVKNLRHGKRRPTKNGEMVMLSGLLECPTCGRKHQFCGSYRKKGKDCTSNSIMLGVLEKIVAEHLRMITEVVAIDENAFAEKLMVKGANSQKSDIEKKEAELDKSKRRVAEKIVVHEKVRTDEAFFDSRGRPRKPIRQQVDIYYNFVGVIG